MKLGPDAVHPSVPHILAWRGEVQGDEPAFAFLDRHLRVVDTDSYGTLDLAARRVEHALDELGVDQRPVLLACGAGLPFVRALFGILRSGRAVVPTPPPVDRTSRGRLARLAGILGCRWGIASRATIAALEGDGGIRWIAIEDASDGAPGHPAVRAQSLAPAIFQFSSGTTGAPHGVCLSHANLMANNEQIRRAFVHTSKHRGLIWLPPHHDMGLVGGVLQPVYAGFRTTLMAPRTFLADPLNWLKAITLTGATTSGGPDFAYARCAEAHEADIERAHLDLYSWQVAFDGAEPVLPSTLTRFADRFRRFGFRYRNFVPCYGLAESTLMVSAAGRVKGPIQVHVEREALEDRRVVLRRAEGPDHRSLVGHGAPGPRVRIVGADSRPVGPFGVGEIWVRGPSVGQPVDADDPRFGATLDDDPSERWLRTGDLGFVLRGELFVTGRSSSVIIVRGKNHQAEDLEATSRSQPGLGALGCAAFQTGERIFVVQEVPRDLEEGPALIERIATSVAEAHGVALFGVVLVRRNSLPRTPSGKVRRRAVADALFAGELRVLHRWQAPSRQRLAEPVHRPDAPQTEGLPEEEAIDVVRQWLTEVLATELRVPAEQLDADTHFGVYGLDSATAASMVAHLANTWDDSVAPTVFWDYPNFSLLAKHLVTTRRQAGSRGHGSSASDTRPARRPDAAT